MAFFLFENDPLSTRRKQDAVLWVGVACFPALLAFLYFGQAYMDKDKDLAIERAAMKQSAAPPETNPAPASESLAQARANAESVPTLASQLLADSTPAAPSNSATTNSSPGKPDDAQVSLLVHEGTQLVAQKKYEDALVKANAAVEAAPQNMSAYCLRGNVYAEKKLWDLAEKDYQAALRIDAKNVQVRFDMAETLFVQKKYDDARPGFADLEHDPNLGDLANYKVFLCDLLGAHDDLSKEELASFNETGTHASFYFANGSWLLYHRKTEEARDWLVSAARIYKPNKFKMYATSLYDLGYLPLPPAPPQK